MNANAKRRVPSTCLLLSGLLALPAPASALFGLGKGKEPVDAETQQDEPRSEAVKMPGMPEGMPPAPSGAVGASPQAPAAQQALSGAQLPQEVVIKGSDAGQKLKVLKPPLDIQTDPFESIRASLQPDESLLLAESPLTVSWRRTRPELLANDRVVQPWRTIFSDRPGIVFNIREQLNDVLQRPLDSKEAKAYQWSLTIADEEGRVFQRYDGSKEPPEEFVWTGQNDQGEWIRAGRSYSAVYMFTDSGGSPHTKVGKPIQFTGIAHQEPDGLHLSLDSAALFGSTKNSRIVEKGGEGLLRAAADVIKRRHAGVPIRVLVYAATKELAEAQAGQIQDALIQELMLPRQAVGTDFTHASFSEQRVEIILLNR